MGGRWAVVIITVAVLLFGIFIWPTPWLYYHHGREIIRVNRFTGSAQELRILPPDPESPKSIALKPRGILDILRGKPASP